MNNFLQNRYFWAFVRFCMCIIILMPNVHANTQDRDDEHRDLYIRARVAQTLSKRLAEKKQKAVADHEQGQDSFHDTVLTKKVRDEIEEKVMAREQKEQEAEKEAQRIAEQEAEQKAEKEAQRIAEQEATCEAQKKNSWHDSSSHRRYEKIYPLPNWPYYTLFFDHKDMVQVTAEFQGASQAYSSRGASQDLSKLVFGDCAITLQEILLVSKLIQQDKLILPCVPCSAQTTCPTLVDTVVPGSDSACDFGTLPPQCSVNKKGYYLGALACQKFEFDACEQNYQVALNYSRNFKKGDVTVGFHVPMVVKSHKLTLKTKDIDPAVKKNLMCIEQNSTNIALNFTKTYGTLENFFCAILQKKGISFNHKNTELGMGDFVGFVNFRVHAPQFSRLMLGASILLPTGRKREPSQLWPKDFGNGGFVEFAGFASALWGNCGIWNPYLHAKVSGSVSAKIDRRVPEIISYDASNPALTGQSPCAAGLNIILSDAVGLKSLANGGAFCFPDSTIRGFADTVHRIKIRPGPELFVRAGNTFAGIFSRNDFLDLYYDFMVKGRDYLASTQDRRTLTPGIWTANTFRMSHTIGLNYSYQFNEKYRARFGGSYVFAGRNTPKTFGLDLSLNIDF